MSVSLERHSKYTVHISEVNGRVLRKWLSFDIAREHYRGGGPYAQNKWTDNYIAHCNPELLFELSAYRWEARVILTRREEAARVHGERIRARRLRKKHARS